VVISLLNAFTGLAVGFEGYVLGNPALIVAGIVVGASGTLLTQLMAKAMNRPITNIIFTPITGAAPAGRGGRGHDEGSLVDGCRRDDALRQKVIIVPGYGMAVAGAQHKVWEMTQAAGGGGRRGGVRHPPGGGPHARPHERAAGRSRCALRARSSTWKRSTKISPRPTWPW
jgi:NAD(P) transhydrogenase subunit beta